jgi:hypothetical protein
MMCEEARHEMRSSGSENDAPRLEARWLPRLRTTSSEAKRHAIAFIRRGESRTGPPLLRQIEFASIRTAVGDRLDMGLQ